MSGTDLERQPSADGKDAHVATAAIRAARRRARLVMAGWATPALAALALVAALIVGPTDHPSTRTHPTGPPNAAAALELLAARQRAALEPCRAPHPTNPGPARLRGLVEQCLGDGGTVDLGATVGGVTTVVNLWASWCEVCRRELPVLEAYAHTPGGARVLGVQVHDQPLAGLSLLTGLGVRFPSVVDTDDAAIRALRAPPYLPVSYVVTPDGVIRQVLPPSPFTTTEQIQRAVRSLTSNAPPPK